MAETGKGRHKAHVIPATVGLDGQEIFGFEGREAPTDFGMAPEGKHILDV
jgi:hypothetical protein